MSGWAMLAFRRRRRASDIITASELACYVYCPERWRLEYGVGLRPANHAALDAGDHHIRKAVAERVPGVAIAVGRVLAVAAALLLVLSWLLWR
jgi:hypothetical protein